MLDRFERFSFAISEISRCWRKLASEELAKYELKSPHATYLTTMYKYPQGITVPQLCEVCGKDKSDASRMLAILEEKGLINKQVVDGSLYRWQLVFKFCTSYYWCLWYDYVRSCYVIVLSAKRETVHLGRSVSWFRCIYTVNRVFVTSYF